MVQFSAKPIRIVYSTAVLLITGNEPGRPRHTGQTPELGGAPKAARHPQNILVLVASSTCVSSPSTGSYRVTAWSKGTGRPAACAFTLIVPPPFPCPGRPTRCRARRPAGGGRAAGQARPRRP